MHSYEENDEFLEIIEDLITNDKVKQMKKFRQHGETTTFDHCINVSYVCYLVCKKMNWDYKSAARGAMLHDLFLYDWRDKRPNNGLLEKHAFSHPRIALKNAEEEFNLNNIEKDVILKHMWPVTLFHLPKYKESFVITIADKYCAMGETGQSVANQIIALISKAKNYI